ncbi:MAG: N-acetyltransferase [Campylobacteraceae bacterium]|jgi:amino-acid N-acetyltransferase|nr:N-acetyltransferase [Campylobacteraceae bacterium]MBT6107617.1 N-acetyltransferase [Campylobacteraceae bacterium]
MNIKYFHPTVNNIESMQKLVEQEVIDGIILHRSDDEIATTIRSYICVEVNNELAGFVALHIHSKNLAEVRSLVINKNFRGLGLGKGLVLKCLEEAKRLNITEVLSLTYQNNFFEKLGFNEIDKETIPEHKIWADCVKCKHFPVCNEIALTISIL